MPYIYEAYVVPGSILVPSFVVILKHRILSKPLRILSLYLLVSCLINIAAVVMALNNHSNLWLLHIYTIAESVLLLLFFLALSLSQNIRKIIAVLVVLLPLFCVVNLLMFEPASRFNSYPRSVEALIFICLAVGYWLVGTEQDRYGSWAENPYNWVMSGILLYFASSFSLFLFSDVMLTDRKSKPSPEFTQIVSVVWFMHGTLVIIQYLLFAVGVAKYKR